MYAIMRKKKLTRQASEKNHPRDNSLRERKPERINWSES